MSNARSRTELASVWCGEVSERRQLGLRAILQYRGSCSAGRVLRGWQVEVKRHTHRSSICSAVKGRSGM
jgi:hypothetical protein